MIEFYQIFETLAQDKTTGKRIIWGTDDYLEYGSQYEKNEPIIVFFKNSGDFVIEPKITKEKDFKRKRAKNHAEVFTPAWLCNKMINYCDDDWFGRQGVFNTEVEKSWIVNDSKIEFSDKKDWKAYVDSRRLEITCGEAPYIVSRYDVSTGGEIEIEKRIGILDRKLRVVGESCKSEEEWLEWAERAFQSVYGYEMQGDNLILCRKNLLLTFEDYLKQMWNREPTSNELKKIANIIAWNFWQMDMLKDSACKIRNWRSRKTIIFNQLGK